MLDEIEEYERENNKEMDYSLYQRSEFDQILLSGENILWEGKYAVCKKPLNIASILYQIFFATIWTAFSIFWGVTAFKSGGRFFALFAVPFICIGFYLFYKAFAGNKKESGVLYALTNMRIMKYSKINKDYFECVPLNKIDKITLKNVQKEIGTIIIQRDQNQFSTDEMKDVDYGSYSDGFSINCIDEAENVLKLIYQAIADYKSN